MEIGRTTETLTSTNDLEKIAEFPYKLDQEVTISYIRFDKKEIAHHSGKIIAIKIPSQDSEKRIILVRYTVKKKTVREMSFEWDPKKLGALDGYASRVGYTAYWIGNKPESK